MGLLDSHCHLHHCAEDALVLLSRARQAGLSGIVQVGTDVASARFGLELSRRAGLPIPVYPSAGLYPTRAAGPWREELPPLRELLAAGGIRAVGEAGLDRHHAAECFPEQVAMLRAQLELACEFKLPIILHCRQAAAPLLELIADFQGAGLRGVWHCFDGTQEEAALAIERGLHLSLSGLVTFKSAKALQEVSRGLPRERLLIETDSPYLSPVPLRGRPNEPAHVVHVRDFLAQLFGEDPARLAETFAENTRALFGIPEEK